MLNRRQHQNLRARRGSVYILLIGVSVLAATIAVAATIAGRIQSRTSDSAGDTNEARNNAQAAVDLGRLYMSQNNNWRSLKSNGTWWTGMRVGNGTMSLDVSNPIGALNRFDADPVILTGTGYRNSAVQRLRVSLAPG